MHISGIHTAPYGLTQIATPHTHRVSAMHRSEHAADLSAVIDRVTINRARAGEEAPAAEPARGKSASSPAHLVKAEGNVPGGESLFGALVAAFAKSDR